MSANPTDVGARVLTALDAGRAEGHRRARERAAPWHRLIRAELDSDTLRGHGARGRAARIKRRLRLPYSERHVKRILDTFSSVSDSLLSNETSDSPCEGRTNAD